MKKRAMSVAVVAAALAFTWAFGGAPVPAVPAPCTWTVDRQPGIAPRGNFLMRVSGASSSDVWAVGAQFDGGKGRPLTERWDGSRWHAAPAPTIGSSVSGLQDVVVLGPTDAWAVGHARGRGPMVQRWDGARWRLVTAPVPGGSIAELLGVAATSASDVWAVGKAASGADYRTLIERFDGAAWRIVPSPNLGADNVLRDVDARSRSNAWAVGWRVEGRRYRTLALHWNGRAWRVVPTPNAGAADNFLSGVAVLSANDAWAVGWASTGPDASRTLIEHWDGARWAVVDSPSPGSGTNSLFGVDARDGTGAWAVGSSSEGEGPFRSLVERWDGSAWQVVPSANDGAPSNILSGVTADAGSISWAVGTRVVEGGSYGSLVERSC